MEQSLKEKIVLGIMAFMLALILVFINKFHTFVELNDNFSVEVQK